MNESIKRTVTVVVALAVLGYAGLRIYKQLDKKKPAAEQSQPSGDMSGDMSGEMQDEGMAGGPGDLTPPEGRDKYDFAREQMKANRPSEEIKRMREQVEANPEPVPFDLAAAVKGEMPATPGSGGAGQATPAAVQGRWILHIDRTINQFKQMMVKQGKPFPPQAETLFRQMLRAGGVGETRVIGPKGITILVQAPKVKLRQDWATQVVSVTPQRVRIRITQCRVQVFSGTEPEAKTWEQQYPGKVVDIVHVGGFMRFEPLTPMDCAEGIFFRQ